MLTTQYRMTKEICAFPSKRFYEDKLRPAKQLASEKPWPLRPYIVLKIKGREQKSSDGYIVIHNYIWFKNVSECWLSLLCEMMLYPLFSSWQCRQIVKTQKENLRIWRDSFQKRFKFSLHICGEVYLANEFLLILLFLPVQSTVVRSGPQMAR